MKINFDSAITNLDGFSPARDDKGAAITLQAVALTALMAMLPEDQNMQGDEKASRFRLALRIHAGGEQDMAPEDATTLKRLIGRCYGPLVVGRAYELLNG